MIFFSSICNRLNFGLSFVVEDWKVKIRRWRKSN